MYHSLRAVEDAYIRQVIRETKSLAAAACCLGIDPATLYRRTRKARYLEAPEYRVVLVSLPVLATEETKP